MTGLLNNLVDTARNSFFNTLLSFIETEIIVFGKKTINLEFDDFMLQPENIMFTFHGISGKKLKSTPTEITMTGECKTELKESIEFICDFDLVIEPINKNIIVYINNVPKYVSPRSILGTIQISANTPFKLALQANSQLNLKLFRK